MSEFRDIPLYRTIILTRGHHISQWFSRPPGNFTPVISHLWPLTVLKQTAFEVASVSNWGVRAAALEAGSLFVLYAPGPQADAWRRSLADRLAEDESLTKWYCCCFRLTHSRFLLDD